MIPSPSPPPLQCEKTYPKLHYRTSPKANLHKLSASPPKWTNLGPEILRPKTQDQVNHGSLFGLFNQSVNVGWLAEFCCLFDWNRGVCGFLLVRGCGMDWMNRCSIRRAMRVMLPIDRVWALACENTCQMGWVGFSRPSTWDWTGLDWAGLGLTRTLGWLVRTCTVSPRLC